MLRRIFRPYTRLALLLAIFTSARGIAADTTLGFTPEELRAFSSIEPVDTHVHAFKLDDTFYAMLKRLHLHLVDIVVANKHEGDFANLGLKIKATQEFVTNSRGFAVLCTTFDPFRFSDSNFPEEAIRQLNSDFERGAVAVKIWKNIGMELQDAGGRFVMPDDPRLQPIYQDIASHGKALIAHVADPDSCWQPPNKNSPDYMYFNQHPEWYMYTKPDHPAKATIIRARDHMLEQNPNLRVVGAHLGSLETELDEIGRRLDRYPNFAVDTAARVIYLVMQPREKARQFLIKYQDRVLYGTDLGFSNQQSTDKAIRAWEKQYSEDWRFFSSNGSLEYRGRTAQGLGLPEQVLRKLYHENAVRWITPFPSEK